jgi:nucleoside-diphosphate-sugar epimerase
VPLVADLATPEWLNVLPPEADFVVYLAQSRRYRDFPDGAADMLRINVYAVFELLEWARKHGVRKFLYASTGNVYRPGAALLHETDPCEPASLYAATKLSAEHLIRQYRRFFQTTILRLFSVYGPRQPDMIVPMMVERVRTGQEITLAQGVGLYFTPLYVSDCVDMLMGLLMGAQLSAETEIYNLAGNDVVQLDEVVELIASMLGVSPLVRHTDNTPTYLLGSNEKIRRTLGWKPVVDFATGLRRTMQQQEVGN